MPKVVPVEINAVQMKLARRPDTPAVEMKDRVGLPMRSAALTKAAAQTDLSVVVVGFAVTQRDLVERLAVEISSEESTASSQTPVKTRRCRLAIWSNLRTAFSISMHFPTPQNRDYKHL
jgi:hypothetical protein